MNAVTFDTLAFSKTLQDAGMPRQQAEALAEAQKGALDAMLAAGRLASQNDISRLELRLVEKMGELKHELLKWMVGAMIAQTALIVAVIAFLK